MGGEPSGQINAKDSDRFALLPEDYLHGMSGRCLFFLHITASC